MHICVITLDSVEFSNICIYQLFVIIYIYIYFVYNSNTFGKNKMRLLIGIHFEDYENISFKEFCLKIYALQALQF